MNKYRAIKVIDAGHTFASKMEHARFCELILMQKAGLIDQLEIQPKYPAIINGIKVCTIIMDFRYICKTTGEIVVEDVKGMDNPMSRLKRKILSALYPDFDIRVLTKK